MTTRQALDWIKQCGIAVESGHADVPSLTEFVIGKPLKGSWWGHMRGREIFRLSRAIRNSTDVLTCRLAGGKITYVHRRLWPALVKLADEFSVQGLAAIVETHTPRGKHKVAITRFPAWVPKQVIKDADRLTEQEAAERLAVLLRTHPQPNHATQPTASRRTASLSDD